MQGEMSQSLLQKENEKNVQDEFQHNQKNTVNNV